MTIESTSKRTLAKMKTRQRVMDAAKQVWAVPGSYNKQGGIRDVAAKAGMSTGAVFANFDTKEDLWKAVFGTPAPIDSPLTRAAHEMQRILQNLLEQRPEVVGKSDAPNMKDWDDAERLIDRLKDQALIAESDRLAA